jgi:D-aspartate ligase
MFETASAVDVVRAQHLDLTGRTIGCSEMVDNRLFIVESICALSYIRGGRSAWPTEASKKDTYSRELAWWNGDDRLPVVAMFARLVPRTVQRALRYFWAGAIRVLRKHWRRNEAES